MLVNWNFCFVCDGIEVKWRFIVIDVCGVLWIGGGGWGVVINVGVCVIEIVVD